MFAPQPTVAGPFVRKRALGVVCALALALGCSKEAGSGGPQTIRETGYLACRVDAAACDAASVLCESTDGTTACVEKPAACTGELTCDCAAALCGDAPCRDLDGTIQCRVPRSDASTGDPVDAAGTGGTGGTGGSGGTGGDGSARPQVRADFRPEVQPFQAGLRFTLVSGDAQDGPFQVTGPVLDSGFGAPPEWVEMPLGEAYQTPLQAAWLRVADASTEILFAYALPWAVAAPAVGDTVTLSGNWNPIPSEFVQPMGYVALHDAAGDLQMLVADDFEPPEVSGISLGRGAFAGDLTRCDGPTHMYALAAGAGGANVEVPYGGQSQVGPFVVLHGGLLEFTTSCPEFSPRTLASLAVLRGRLADLEDGGSGPCGATSCASGELCDAPACDRSDPAAACNPTPPLSDCPDTPSPVCGCDGAPYESACVAAHRGVAVARDETGCLAACDGGLRAGPCNRTWSCGGHDLGVSCFRTAADDATALCECTLDGTIVDRVPYASELCNEADMRAACRLRGF